MFVTKEEEAIAWGDAKRSRLVNVQYHLYICATGEAKDLKAYCS